MTSHLYLSLFAAASAGTLVDAVLDRKIGIALLTSIAHLLGFLAVLQWAMPDLSYRYFGLAVLCVMSCVWDVWTSLRCAGLAWGRGDGGDAEVLGVALLLGARMPAYACPVLLAQGWLS